MKNCGDPDTEPTRWALWRLDDNDNRFVVAVFARREEAEAAARAFEAHGHKQTYWVECCARCRTVTRPDLRAGFVGATQVAEPRSSRLPRGASSG